MRLFHYAQFPSGFDCSRFPDEKILENSIGTQTVFQHQILRTTNINLKNIKDEAQRDTEPQSILLTSRPNTNELYKKTVFSKEHQLMFHCSPALDE